MFPAYGGGPTPSGQDALSLNGGKTATLYHFLEERERALPKNPH
jgi:hypothetical protein